MIIKKLLTILLMLSCSSLAFAHDVKALSDNNLKYFVIQGVAKPEMIKKLIENPADPWVNAAKITIGTDLVSPWQVTVSAEAAYQLLEPKALKPYFSNIQILRGVTSTGGELMQLSGPNHPYQDGPLGVNKEGAYADILLVKGNPLKDIMVITDDENFGLIMKDGKIYKNIL